jgi:hypothetical protein
MAVSGRRFWINSQRHYEVSAVAIPPHPARSVPFVKDNTATVLGLQLRVVF